jgi:hypothetical protein
MANKTVRMRTVSPTLAIAVVFTHVATSQAIGEGCRVEGREYVEGTQIEAYRITGMRTRTAVPVYVICRHGQWVWPGTNEAVVQKKAPAKKDAP